VDQHSSNGHSTPKVWENSTSSRSSSSSSSSSSNSSSSGTTSTTLEKDYGGGGGMEGRVVEDLYLHHATVNYGDETKVS